MKPNGFTAILAGVMTTLPISVGLYAFSKDKLPPIWCAALVALGGLVLIIYSWWALRYYKREQRELDARVKALLERMENRKAGYDRDM